MSNECLNEVILLLRAVINLVVVFYTNKLNYIQVFACVLFFCCCCKFFNKINTRRTMMKDYDFHAIVII